MKKILLFLITIYQNTLTHYTPTCRFTPSCSQYMREAVEKYGAWEGFVKGMKRFSTCHPCSGKSGWDPVE
ncbi:membrane protein insertion efficiency factor YidD [Candidatus Nomurabacteria bacterium]|nr:membrane protein insertion efficiency factor YidD [Candidatus Nomurabacteria bacterium]